MTVKRKSPWKPHRHSDEATMRQPRFLPGDPIVDVGDGSTGRIDFSRSDGTCCVTWDHSSRREWVHEDALTFAPGFTPTRRRG
jgi:hypothetical protein